MPRREKLEMPHDRADGFDDPLTPISVKGTQARSADGHP
jgi:hypothetical protein